MKTPYNLGVPRQHWTKEEDDFLTSNYESLGAPECAGVLNKTVCSVCNRVTKKGLNYRINLQTHKEIPPGLWTGLLRGARDRDLIVQIDRAYIWDLYIKQNRRCALTGWDVLFSLKKGLNTASVDRIDSDLGYLLGNVQIVHKLVNRAKVNYNELDFYALCKAVHQHRSGGFERWERFQYHDILNDTTHEVRRKVLGRPELLPDFSEEAIFGEPDSPR